MGVSFGTLMRCGLLYYLAGNFFASGSMKVYVWLHFTESSCAYRKTLKKLAVVRELIGWILGNMTDWTVHRLPIIKEIVN